ncbi:hypothetical protein BJ138DRAFT_1108168, partial [Hygrophoropsis aurantiaca]
TIVLFTPSLIYQWSADSNPTATIADVGPPVTDGYKPAIGRRPLDQSKLGHKAYTAKQANMYHSMAQDAIEAFQNAKSSVQDAGALLPESGVPYQGVAGHGCLLGRQNCGSCHKMDALHKAKLTLEELDNRIEQAADRADAEALLSSASKKIQVTVDQSLEEWVASGGLDNVPPHLQDQARAAWLIIKDGWRQEVQLQSLLEEKARALYVADWSINVLENLSG